MNRTETLSTGIGSSHFQKIASLIIDNSLLGIVLIDSDLKMVAVNARFCEIVGYGPEQLLGHSFAEIIHGDDLSYSKELLKQGLAGDKSLCVFQQKYVHKQGHIVPVKFSLIADGKTAVDSASDPDGDLAVVTMEDISQQLAADLKLKEQAEQIQSLERERILSEVASGIAHEINQPLAAISAYAQSCQRLLQQDSLDTEKIRSALGKLVEQVYRAGSVTEQIREFARPRPRRKESCDCNALVDIAKQLALSSTAKSIQVQTDYAADLPPLYCDPVEVLLVVVCLMRNAIDSIKSTELKTDHEIKLVTAQLENDDVLISVTDSGQGVHMSVEKDLFLPFASTKLHSIGLGLTVSQSIINEHGGKLSYTSDSSGTTTFTLVLSLMPGHKERIT